MSDPAPQDSAHPDRWPALVACLLAGFMTLLDVSIVNVALPSIQHGLHAAPDDISWLKAGYTLTFGLCLIPAGRLGDAFGRKGMFLTGVALFAGVSGLCAVAPNPSFLVVARLLQGVAGGLLNPQIIGTIQQLFRGPERGRAFGFYGATVAIGTAIGPLAGGLLITVGGWRWVFLVNVPIGLIALVLGMRLIPAIPPARRSRRVDPLGIGLAGGAITSTMLPLVELQQTGAAVHWWLLGLAAALLTGFVTWELFLQRIGEDPLIDLRLLASRTFSMSSAVGLVYFAGYPILLFILSLYLQQGQRYSPLAAGATAMPFAVGSALSSSLSGQAVYRIGRLMVVAGLAAVTVSLSATALLIHHDAHRSVWASLVGPLLVAGLGSGLVIGPNQTLALRHSAPAASGTAAAVLQTGQRIGTSIGSAVGASCSSAACARTAARTRQLPAGASTWPPLSPASHSCSLRSIWRLPASTRRPQAERRPAVAGRADHAGDPRPGTDPAQVCRRDRRVRHCGPAHEPPSLGKTTHSELESLRSAR